MADEIATDNCLGCDNDADGDAEIGLCEDCEGEFYQAINFLESLGVGHDYAGGRVDS